MSWDDIIEKCKSFERDMTEYTKACKDHHDKTGEPLPYRSWLRTKYGHLAVDRMEDEGMERLIKHAYH